VISRVTRGIDSKDWDRGAIATAFDSIAPMFQRLEDELAGKDYLVGSYSIADVAFTPNLARQIELGVGLPEKFPRVRAWVERLMQRPNYQSIHAYVSQH